MSNFTNIESLNSKAFILNGSKTAINSTLEVADTTTRLALTNLFLGQRVKELDSGNIYRLELVGGESSAINWSSDYIETFDSIILLNGTENEINIKNASGIPMEEGEPAFVTDLDILLFRKSTGQLVKLRSNPYQVLKSNRNVILEDGEVWRLFGELDFESDSSITFGLNSFLDLV